ncbi:MAG: DUF362 domain-containing protein [Thermodesulfobacteriota bacterium]|nr:DUF362 domain-containing protein [Thermodesulfobacteriota bacterium]
MALDNIGAQEVIAKQSLVLIKPNLVNASAHPVTTSLDCCEAVIEYVSSCSKADIIIAEGCGDMTLETGDVFDILGYRELSRHYGISLVDLNESLLVKLSNRSCPVFPYIYLPKIAFTHFIISLPVLKAHSLSIMTGTLKNMIGFAPPKYYSGRYGNWKKSLFHRDIHQSIIDLNRYRSADLSIMDASVGLAEYHLGGRQCTPPVNKIIAGFNPLEVDRKAAELLKLNWEEIQHLSILLNLNERDL